MNIPDNLISKILTKKCILFLGAGATKTSGGVLGNELGDYIYREIGDIGIDYKDNLARYTQALVNSGYRDSIEKIVRKRFSQLQPNDKFKNIASIPWKAIYTTNYDDLIEKSYYDQHFFNCVVNSFSNTTQCFGEADIPLYKINGDINTPFQENQPLIITLNDLRSNKVNNEKMISQLMQDMNDTFIFIGYSFQDDNEIVTDILDAFQKSNRWESVKEKYVILPNISDDIRLELESYRINFIQGTADEFFNIVGQKSQNNYKIKLNALKKTFSSNDYLRDLPPQTLQYISDCFDIYDSEKLYPVDGKYFYRGGRPDWGIIKEHFDIARNLEIQYNKSKKIEITTDDLYSHIQSLLEKNEPQKVLLEGTAISGKTTALYRCAYDLMANGTLSMIFKQQAKYKDGLLSTIYEKKEEPFVVFSDDIFIDVTEQIKMQNEAKRCNLPIIFIISTRHSDWANTLSNYNKNVLSPFDVTITMRDSFSADEASNFVDKLILSKIISASNSYEKKGYIRNFQKNNNIIQVLIELIDNNEIVSSLSNEYDSLCDETKYAYGIVSLVYKYGLKTKWEILQRTISKKFLFSWEDFIEKILHNDAKGNLYDDEIQGNFYILGRHRYICNMIVQIHFGGNYSDEISVLKELISSSTGTENDERFIGGLIHSILQDEQLYYTKEQIIDLLDYAINTVENPNNSSFINHIKGEYYLRLQDYISAIRCFNANVHNELNEEYSIHSLGKSYFYLAQRENIYSAEFRMHMDMSIEKLMNGVKKYRKNQFYYALLLSIFSYLNTHHKLSEKNIRSQNELKDIAISSVGIDTYNKILIDKSNDDLSME
mgnify:CR=1 FL=1|jgi:hypothetical protein